MPGAALRYPFLVGLGLLIIIAFTTRRASSDDCLHSCPSADYDAQGCCPAKAKPPPSKPVSPPKLSTPKQPAKASPPPPIAPTKQPVTTPPMKGCPAGMVRVPSGTFSMGDKASSPEHKVTLSGYCIDTTEVTVAAYGKCVTAGKCSAAAADVDCNGSAAGKDAHPINCVDWGQASTYCAWMSGRLPTEAEWEYAARGSDGRTYPWGNDAPTSQRLNWKREHEGTTPVGSFSDGASPFGAVDMAGNVWEWVADWYGPYRGDAQTNPIGAGSGVQRVVRGGNWISTDAGVRATSRNSYDPVHRFFVLGFRCARGD